MSAERNPREPQAVQVGSHVEVELVYEVGVDQLEFDIVPDQQADFAHGFLGEGTPLAQAILGKFAGEAIQYTVGDAQMVMIIAVSAGKRGEAEKISARRQDVMRKALEQAQRTSAIIFASSYSGKWGDYDPGGIEAWEAKDARDDQDKTEESDR